MDSLEREYANLEARLGYYYSQVLSRPLIPPEHVYFCLTARCNLRCKMCDIPKDTSAGENELNITAIKDIILQIKEMRVKHIIFSGGEPLLKEGWLEILEFALSQGVEMTSLITNGTLFNDLNIQTLIRIGFHHLTVSLDGLKDANDEIRGKGVFENVIGNIDKINYYKSKYETLFPTVGINFTITDTNINDMLPMIELARQKRCNILLFQPLLFSNIRVYEKRKNVLWPLEENIFKLEEVIREVENLRARLTDLCICTDMHMLKMIPNYFRGERPGGPFKCYEAIKRINITPRGDLWSCRGIYGNLREDKLRNIWFSKKAKMIRATLKQCKEHCLQDCVFFRPNIRVDMKNFLSKLNSLTDNRKIEIKDRLLGRIEYYIDSLLPKRKLFFPNFFVKPTYEIGKETARLRKLRDDIQQVR